jgi:hypothetical protein
MDLTEMKAKFAVLDVDGSGSVSLDEIREYIDRECVVVHLEFCSGFL